MKRILCIILGLLAAGIVLNAQNNPYDIDNDCWEYFSLADRLVTDLSNNAFDAANEALLKTAIEKKDEKARTLYYVLKLRRVCREQRNREDRVAANATVEAARNELLQIVKQTGFRQYYYYGYETCQNYYVNTKQEVRAQNLMQEMMDKALEESDEYGFWCSQRYIGILFLNQNDQLNARKHLRRVVEIYEATSDPLIRKQSVTRSFCDLASTYGVASDSARYYFRKAEASQPLAQDSLLVAYYKAQLAAYDKDIAAYRKNHDFCVAYPNYTGVIRSADLFFACLEDIVNGVSLDEFKGKINSLQQKQQIVFLRSLAIRYSRWDVAAWVGNLVINSMYRDITRLNTLRADEISAAYGNNELTMQLNRQQEQTRKITLLVMVLTVLILLGALVFSMVYIRNLQKTNEKVRLADAAKTRFVQNMSHEVRTPLNAIVGFSQLLSLPDGSFPEEEKEEFSSHIVNNTKMLTMLLDDILNASAMDKGNYNISYEEGEKDFMAREAISSAEHRLQPGVALNYIPEDPQPFTFTTDPRRVQQILINLITNACKHTSSGEIKVESSLKSHPGFLAYTITDTGPGIPPDQAEKIFERFTKLNEFVQGTGLGLSICRDIASRMGAEVYLDTSYTDGARFVFLVPVNPPKN